MNSIDEAYSNVNLILGSSKYSFMNHGYYPPLSFIDSNDFLFKNQITLYLMMFDGIEVNNKSILDIGCGRGGGVGAINKYLNPKSIYACDQNFYNIEYCKQNQDKKINFKQLSAENLEYPDNYFDIVTNVESSHCYKNPDDFFKEVHRVLKPGGIFLYTDCENTIKDFENKSNLFNIIKSKDLTKNIQMSCEKDYKKYKNYIKEENIKNLYCSIAIEKMHEYSLSDNLYIFYSAKKKET